MVRLWDIAKGEPVGEPLGGYRSPVCSLAFSPDGRMLAAASMDKTLWLWDGVTGEPMGSRLYGETLAFSTDGRVLVVGHGATRRFWSPKTGAHVGSLLTGHSGAVESVAFSPDGTMLASGSTDKTIRLWDPATSKPIVGPLTGHTDWVVSVAFSPDGTLLASGSTDRTVRLWKPGR